MSEEFAEDAALEGRRQSESPDEFRARLALLDRVSPVLRDLSDHGWDLSVESTGGEVEEGTLTTDFILQFGDLRLRLLLFPLVPRPLDAGLMSRLAHFMLEVPDTDALIVAGDDEQVTSWVLDVYDMQRGARQSELEGVEEGRPLLDALRSFASSNLFAVDLPDFRDIVVLPQENDLQRILSEVTAAHFTRVKSQNARIPEKIAALESLSGFHLQALQDALAAALHGTEIDVSTLVGEPRNRDD